MTVADYHLLCEGVLDRMVRAGWIEGYIFRVEKGVTIKWTTIGSRRALFLRGIACSYELNHGLCEARNFDAKARTLIDPNLQIDELPREIAAFWRNCMNELGLEADNYDFSNLLPIIEKFAPQIDAAET